MSDPQYKNPASGGLTLAGGGTPKVRAYTGRNPYHPFDGVWSDKGELLGKADDKGIWDKYENAGMASWDASNKFSFGPHPVVNGVAGSSDVDPYAGQEASLQQAIVKGIPAAARTSNTVQVTPSDVKANAQMNAKPQAQQKSIAEQQADYIRSRGGRTAAEADAEFESNLRKDYSEATGFDINTAEGRRKSFQAALQRGGHADAMARNLRAGKYEYLDPNSDAGMRASEAARQKLFTGNDWVGENQLTGEFKSPAGDVYPTYDAFKEIGTTPKGFFSDDEIRDDLPAYPEEPTFSWEQPNYNSAADAVRLNANGTKPNNEPTFDDVTEMYGFPKGSFDPSQIRIRDAFVSGQSAPSKPKQASGWPTHLTFDGGSPDNNPATSPHYAKARRDLSPAFDKALAAIRSAYQAPQNTWTPESGGMFNGVNYSRADSEPQAGGNYGSPKLIDTWTPQAGGRFNGVNYSRADSEPQAGGNYGKPLLFPSKTRPISQPSRAALLGPRNPNFKR
jgi:hypothetical protein